MIWPLRPPAGNIADLGATARAATGHAPIAGAVSYNQRAAELACRRVSQLYDLPQALDYAGHVTLRLSRLPSGLQF